jgi:hypothetical protein
MFYEVHLVLYKQALIFRCCNINRCSANINQESHPAVYKIAGETNHNHRITKRDYAWTREGRIILDDGLIRRFLELLERKFQSERPYKFNHGLKRKDGMSMCQEITIMKIQTGSPSWGSRPVSE